MSDADKNTILVVDDEPGFLYIISLFLEGSGYRVVKVLSGQKALEAIAEHRISIMLADLMMPGMSGYELFQIVNRDYPHIPVIILSGQNDIQLAVQIMKEGGFYYMQKPLDLEQLKIIIDKALAEKTLQREIHDLRRQLETHYSFHQIIGKTPRMREVFRTIKLIAPASSTVLILGESGTGKELVARAVHEHSARSTGPFVAINCGAIPGSLMESELFGHEKGAFTGAHAVKPGKFELAQGGSIFLDEIGELPLDLQVKLLRVLQEKSICRIGGTRNIDVDVRVLAASNLDLQAEIERGTFRKDLYYRLSVIPVWLPPLRERREDIPLLAQHFLEKYCRLENKAIKEIDSKVICLLLQHDWPGNIRELENVIERAVVICQDNRIGLDELPVELRPRMEMESAVPWLEIPETGITLKEMEQRLIEKTLLLAEGNKSRCARMLGITRKSLYARLKAYGRDTA
ncbi:sigma-54-dependent Fis family transcriptional regulator [bacterium]|nr:sigma-54-dependent Fis family transcriptional regulator [candidate division CSSED10-310 bacterium]